MAGDHAVVILEQWHGRQPGRNLVKNAQRHVRLAAPHSAQGLGQEGGPRGKVGKRRLGAEGVDQRRPDLAGDRVRAGNPEAAPGRAGIERRDPADGFAKHLDKRLDARTQLHGALGGLQPVRAAYEQRVSEHVTQSAKRMADG